MLLVTAIHIEKGFIYNIKIISSPLMMYKIEQMVVIILHLLEFEKRLLGSTFALENICFLI